MTSSETKVSEMETAVEDLQWDIEKLRKREQKLNKHLAEALEQVCLIICVRGWVCILCVCIVLYLIIADVTLHYASMTSDKADASEHASH